MGDRHDYVALEWVKGEIQETLLQAQHALEAYVENPEDAAQLRFCLAYIHQVSGTLQMVEFYGAGLLSEEMEKLASSLVSNAVPASEDTLSVLMQAILQLPAYLDRVKASQQDLPVILLPLLNELRSSRGESLLSETALFNPDLSAARPELPPVDSSKFNDPQFIELLRKLRQMYQYALIGILRNTDLESNWHYSLKVFERLVAVGGDTPQGQLWRVADAFLHGLAGGAIELTAATKKLLKYLDRSLKQVVDRRSDALSEYADDELVKNLLYYIAKSEGETADPAKLAHIQKAYKLDTALPDASNLADQQAKMTGPDRDTMDSVVAALMEELGRIKDNLDIMVRGKIQDVNVLANLLPEIRHVADTMAVLGLGIPRRVLLDQVETIDNLVANNEVPSDGTLMDIAGALLYVEATLSGISDEAAADDEGAANLDGAQEAVVREARNGLEQAKEAINDYIGSQFDPSSLNGIPAALAGIRGGLLMIPLEQAANVVGSCAAYIQDSLSQPNFRPEWRELDTLADALMGVEYYLERLTQDGRGTNEQLLAKAEASVADLGHPVTSYKPVNVSTDTEAEAQVAEADAPEAEPATESTEPEVTADVAEAESDADIVEAEVVETPVESEDDSTLALEDDGEEFHSEPVAEEEDDSPLSDAFDFLQAPDDEPEPFVEELVAESVVEEEPAPVAEPEPAPAPEPVAIAPVAEDDDDDDDLIDDEIVEIFLEEAEEVLEAINEYFPKYRANPEDEEALTEFRRAFHTLKGSGRMVGAEVVGELAWAVENMLNRLIDGTAKLSVDLLDVVQDVTDLVPILVDDFRHQRGSDMEPVELLSEKANLIATNKWSSDAAVKDEAGQTDEVAEEEPGIEVAPEDALVVDELPVAEAEELPESHNPLLDIFRNELDTHLGVVEEFTQEAEAHGKPVPLKDVVQRALHTIKGSAHMAGLHAIADLALPAERMIKEFQEWHVNVDDELRSLLTEAVGRIRITLACLESGEPEPDDNSDFVERVQRLHHDRISKLKDMSSSDDPNLMGIFMSESMDIMLDAEQIVSRWQQHEIESEELQRLHSELRTLAGAAQAVDLKPVVTLSEALATLYGAVIDQRVHTSEEFFAAAIEGQDVLISMMDRLAAGQSIQTRNQIEERLLNLIPDAVDAPETPVADDPFADLVEAEEPELPDADFVEEPVEEAPAEIAPVAAAEPTPPVEPAAEAAPQVAAGELHHVEGEPELVSIFLEEAQDILEEIATSFSGVSVEGAGNHELEALQRELHTLKGGARMAEISPIGDLAHELEFLYEDLVNSRYPVTPALLKLCADCHDRLSDMIHDVEANMQCTTAPDLLDKITRYRKNPGLADAEDTAAQLPVAPAPVEETLETPEVVELPSAVEEDDSEDLALDLGLVEADTSDTVVDFAPEEPVAEAPEPVEPVVESSIPQPPADLTEDLDEVDSEFAEMVPQIDADMDLDILEIFIDEAGELLHELDSAIHDWQEEPSNELHADEMKRVLHTLKGGARLAKLAMLGDKSHEFESFIINAQRNKIDLDERFFNQVLARNDELVTGIDVLNKALEAKGMGGAVGPSVIAQVDEFEDDESVIAESTGDTTEAPAESGPKLEVVKDAPAEPAASNVVPFHKKGEEAEPEKGPQPAGQQKNKGRAQPQETVKVSANLLEDLVNLAGETSISRSRLEQQVSDFGFTLEDMETTIDRLRDQVRRLDLETEAQVSFRQEKAEESNYQDFDPLEMDRYSQIQQLSRSLLESASDLADIRSSLVDKTRDAETMLLQQSRINTELQEGLMQTRMVPFNRLVPRLRRIVRQVSGELDKDIEFHVHNGDSELDRQVLERMISPLEHMLRNAVDHGIESREDRAKTSKKPTGVIEITLSRDGGDAVIRIRDDGAGINVDRVREKATERGLVKPGDNLTDEDILRFILDSGFSTAQKVTQISGRGVGMDVVHSEVKHLGGTMAIDSTLGTGTEFTIRLPVAVSISRALMVSVAEDYYAIPLDTIEGIVRITPQQLVEYLKPDAPAYEYAGTKYRVNYLSTLLGGGHHQIDTGSNFPVPLILVKGTPGRESIALNVDSLMGSREIVVKPLGPQFTEVELVSGATILGDGSVVVILDLSALVRSDLALLDATIQTAVLPAAAGSDMPLPEELLEGNVVGTDQSIKVMVVDDSVTVRKVTSRLLNRHGMDVLLAKDGADAIHQLQDHVPDIMLLDIEMPRMDGFEVASRVRHDSRLKNVPIIMITSRTGQKHKDRALSIGVNEYMGKPFQEGPLLDTIERLVEENRKG